MEKNKRLLPVQGIILFSVVFMLVLGVYSGHFPVKTEHVSNASMHTYLVTIPSSAGVCPYELMTMTKGKLKLIKNSKCVCPYSSGASFMTARGKNIEAIMDLLPSSLKTKVHIMLIDNLTNDSHYIRTEIKTKNS